VLKYSFPNLQNIAIYKFNFLLQNEFHLMLIFFFNFDEWGSAVLILP